MTETSVADPSTATITASVAGRGRTLTVKDIVVETDDARTIVFDVPAELEDQFAYQPGQFLTLRIAPEGQDAVARCYSLSSTPGIHNAPSVTVKRIPGGIASTWVCEQLEPGHTLEVLPPAGLFTVKDTSRNLLLFAGGSGITPVMSILREALVHGTQHVVLVYANRDESSVIFAEQLKLLQREHPERFVVVHLLESLQGIPSAEQLTRVAKLTDLDAATAYICGPGPFMDAVERVLNTAGMAKEHIIIERFVSLSGDPFAAVTLPDPDLVAQDDSAAVDLSVEIDGETRDGLRWPTSVPLLDFLLSQNIDAPFSCREGACSACACRVTRGEVQMERNQVLEKDDLDDGWILGCQAVPVGTDPISVTYDE